LWLGETPLHGRSILLHAEQGLGDTIQFARYAPLVAERGAKVIVEVQPELARLMLSLSGVTEIVARGQSLPPFDCHCPLASLPLALATNEAAIPADVPYLAPIQTAAARSTKSLLRERPLIGLAWSGARAHENDANRSIPLHHLAPLLDLPGVQFVSLQKDMREADACYLQSRPDVVQFGQTFDDFADTAAVVAQLDAVVSVDTAVAHLAGAMGKTLYLLLPFAADFRWLRERSDSPWYPTARLFRPRRLGDWSSAVEPCVQALLLARAARGCDA
jgi:hypothetical protein